jgi:hypothetical protein
MLSDMFSSGRLVGKQLNLEIPPSCTKVWYGKVSGAQLADYSFPDLPRASYGVVVGILSDRDGGSNMCISGEFVRIEGLFV